MPLGMEDNGKAPWAGSFSYAITKQQYVSTVCQ